MAQRATNGAAVRALRRALGIRQESCAAHAGISAPYLANIEAGRKQPPIVIASRLAHVLGVPLDAITYPLPQPPRDPRKEPDGERRPDRVAHPTT